MTIKLSLLMVDGQAKAAADFYCSIFKIQSNC